MSHFERILFPNAESLARAVAGRWLEEIAGAASSVTSYTVALSGGRIMGRLLAELASLARATLRTIDGVDFFWADERCVPLGHPESNFGLAQGALLLPMKVPANRIHRLRGELPPEEAVQAATRELRTVATRRREDVPVLDLVLLGMGEDGHVASLFPDAPAEVVASRQPYLAVVGPKPPPQRITLGYAALAAAQQLWVVASGPGKERALGTSLAAKGHTPLARVLRSRASTLIFTDIGPDTVEPGEPRSG
jgi:6-phosphogluconolactonase